MSLSYRQQRQLRLIEADFHSADPQLAGMLGVFGRLCVGQRMPTWERVSSRKHRIRQAAALLGEAIRVTTAAIRLLLRAVLGLAAAAIPRRGPRLPEQTRRGPGSR